MRSIERIFNYLYFSTWKLLNFAGNVIQIIVCYIMMKLLPFLKKNRDKGIKELNNMFQNEDNGVSLYQSYRIMIISTGSFYASICLYTLKIFNIKLSANNLIYCIPLVFLMTFLTNHCLLWRKDVYKQYFEEFKKIKNEKKLYLHAILFHLGIALFTAFTVYLTVFVF